MSPAELRRAIRKHPDGAKILDAVEKAQAEGWTVREGYGLIHYDSKRCCALGTLGIEKRRAMFHEAAMADLGWSKPTCDHFAAGFDGAPGGSLIFADMIDLGRLFRALLVEAE